MLTASEVFPRFAPTTPNFLSVEAYSLIAHSSESLHVLQAMAEVANTTISHI